MVSGGNSVQGQVGEIQGLISDASETLGQATWAMGTLLARLPDVSESPARGEPQSAGAETQPVSSVAGSCGPDAGPVAGDATPAGGESAGREHRHRRWVRGA